LATTRIRTFLAVPFRLVCVLTVGSVLCGCLWRSYEQIMTVHLEVLSSMTTKLLETARAGGRPSPNDLAELVYPLRRARQFAYQYESYAERPSHGAFVASLDAYEKLIDEVDAARADEQRWNAVQDELEGRAQAFLDRVRRAREALEREK
jgi:hypothetical protein